jgi:anti-sigma regulatory factor (Ser/Thr protein kinase)
MMKRFRFLAGDATPAAEARRSATELATRRGLDESDAGKLALVVTEAATNLVKHAGGGEILVGPSGDEAGVDILSLDRGPGMANLATCLRDGFSTSGSPGTGLGAISRLATRFDIHSTPGAGTALVAAVARGRARPAVPAETFDVGGVSVPAPGEDVCGDGWAALPVADGVKAIVVDGLGHGVAAHEAAVEAIKAFRAAIARPVEEIVDRVHGALKTTRGAAVAVTSIDARRRLVTFCGIGNISGTIVGDGPARNTVSHGGIAGHGAVRIQVFTYPWPERGLLVMCSDGINTHWSLDPYPGLRLRDPALIAGVLYRDFVRGRDDATVVVARERAA